MTAALFRKAEPSGPAVGDKIEFESDRLTDKGPSSGSITDMKVTPDGAIIRVKHSDTQEWMSWADLEPHARRSKHDGGWLIKARTGPIALFMKSYVRAHTRRVNGKVVRVGSYHNSVTPEAKHKGGGRDGRTRDMFAGQSGGDKEGEREGGGRGEPDGEKKFYVTMFRDGKAQPAYLAGPFDSKDEADSHVERARKMANEVDPWSEFDAFGVTGVTPKVGVKLPPGVLNDRLGLPGQPDNDNQ